jgi:integrase
LELGDRQVKRGSFATKTAAEDALAELVDAASKGTVAHGERQTVAAFIRQWLADKERGQIRPTTARLYREHIEDYIIPAIGGVRLRDVRPGHIEQVLAFVARPRPGRRSAGPASVRRVHGTVRSAFGTAKRRRLIAFNPAVDVDLPPAPRPKVRPWEPAELGAFLDHAAADPFATLFEVIAATGVRRGEALDGPDHLCPSCGGVHRRLLLGPPKTRSGDARIVDLDSGTPGALIAHRLRQDAERSVWGDTYSDHGLVFAREDGAPMAPERVSKRFAELAKAVGLRPIRLDLRHGQASLMLAAGVPMAVVSKRLGHSTIALTADVSRHHTEPARGLEPRTTSLQASPAQAVCSFPVSRRNTGLPHERKPRNERVR